MKSLLALSLICAAALAGCTTANVGGPLAYDGTAGPKDTTPHERVVCDGLSAPSDTVVGNVRFVNC